VDAGPGYGRAGGTDCVAVQLTLPKQITRRVLYMDWAEGKNKLGLIKGDNGLTKAVKRSKKKAKTNKKRTKKKTKAQLKQEELKQEIIPCLPIKVKKLKY